MKYTKYIYDVTLVNHTPVSHAVVRSKHISCFAVAVKCVFK